MRRDGETTGGEPTGRSRRRAGKFAGEKREQKSLFYMNRTDQPAKDETGKIRKDKEGNTIYEEAENVRPVMRQYTIFNVEQTDGLKLPPRKAQATPD